MFSTPRARHITTFTGEARPNTGVTTGPDSQSDGRRRLPADSEADRFPPRVARAAGTRLVTLTTPGAGPSRRRASAASSSLNAFASGRSRSLVKQAGWQWQQCQTSLPWQRGGSGSPRVSSARVWMRALNSREQRQLHETATSPLPTRYPNESRGSAGTRTHDAIGTCYLFAMIRERHSTPSSMPHSIASFVRSASS